VVTHGRPGRTRSIEPSREQEAEQLTKALAIDGDIGADVLARLDRWAETLHTDADWSMLAIELQLHANRSRSTSKSA
jgi:hypothetical protein